MKKWLTWLLTLALAVALTSPALAAEETVVVDGHSVPTLDLSELLDGDAWAWGDRASYAEYEAAHPEEIAALDQDALLAGWGFRDRTAEEQFWAEFSAYGDTVEEAVKNNYIDNRLLAERNCREAEAYRAQYPQAWESFDADAFFQADVRDDRDETYRDAAAYMNYWNLLTREEFADDMFVWYVDRYLDEDEDGGGSRTAPALTLMVNGAASEAAITAADGVSYVDAADLRAILGEAAVAADVTGPVAVRAAAEAAGWDVGWYSDDWEERQEVQLWDRAAYLARSEDFRAMDDFLARLAERSWAKVFSEEPIAQRVDLDVTLTRFSTLDGDKAYPLSLTADCIAQKGLVDMTMTFDVAQLLQLLDDQTLAEAADQLGLTADALTQLLREVEAEMVLDYGQGTAVYRIPLLARFDEEMGGWTQPDAGPTHSEDDEAAFDPVPSCYDKMLRSAGWMGAEDAAEEFEAEIGALGLFFGNDRFTTRNGATTYSLTTQTVNEYLRARAEREGAAGRSSPFQTFEAAATLDGQGVLSSLELHARLDPASFCDLGLDNSDLAILQMLGLSPDVDVTAHAEGDQSRSSGQLELHVENWGKLTLAWDETTTQAGRSPRQVDEVATQTQGAGRGGINTPDDPLAILSAQ